MEEIWREKNNISGQYTARTVERFEPKRERAFGSRKKKCLQQKQGMLLEQDFQSDGLLNLCTQFNSKTLRGKTAVLKRYIKALQKNILFFKM